MMKCRHFSIDWTHLMTQMEFIHLPDERIVKVNVCFLGNVHINRGIYILVYYNNNSKISHENSYYEMGVVRSIIALTSTADIWQGSNGITVATPVNCKLHSIPEYI